MSDGRVAAPKEPGALGFKHICEYCERLIDVRSDGEDFRYEPHDMPKTSIFAGMSCPRSDLKFEPT